MKKLKWTIISVGVVLILLWFVFSAMKGMPVRVAEATEGSISEYVEERAKTTLPHIYHITMPLEGRIKPITFKEGTIVKKGQLVCQMDLADINTLIDKTKAKIEEVKGQMEINKYDAMEKTALKESSDWIKTMAELVKVSQKKIDANKHVYEFSEEYAKSMVDSGNAVSRIQRSKAKMEAAVANVEVETATMIYNASKIIQSIFQMAPTYINEFLHTKNLNQKVLESQLNQIKAVHAKCLRDLNRATMKSPIDGVVLKRYVQNERVIPVGEPLIDIGDLNTLQVTSDILSQDVINIKPGDPVDIYGPAIGPEPVKGRVSRVDPKGFTKISSLGVEQQRVKVIVDFEKDVLSNLKKRHINLGDSYRVQVKVFTSTKNKVLKIPRTALFKNSEGKWQVFVVSGSHAILRVIEIGLINDYEVEVLKGLKSGDKVIIAPPTSLINDTRVSVTRD